MGLRLHVRRWLGRDESAADEAEGVEPEVVEAQAASPAEPEAARPAEPEAAPPIEPEPEPVALAPAPVVAPAPAPRVARPAMPRADERRLVGEAWAMVRDHKDLLIVDFYAELFLRLPEAPRMFPSSMTRQRHDFGDTLASWLVADDPAELHAYLDQLGADHRKFEVEPRHYDVAGAAMISAWKHLAGEQWTDEHEDALAASYAELAAIMLDSADRHRAEPAAWDAEVIAHERFAQDFAVLGIRPEQPYPFRAGQFLSVELPSHPREWRQMSLASAPRADNTFDLQVHSIGGGGVSAALVMHTEPGARLRLGSPRGHDLVLRPEALPGALLFVASGTGAAPITALVEELLRSSRRPVPVHVYIGGRTSADLYPVALLDDLIEAAGAGRQMQVHGVVSDEDDFGGHLGHVEEIVPTLQDWAALDLDVLVAGPSSMIATLVTHLVGVGVPLSRIHFDQYDL